MKLQDAINDFNELVKYQEYSNKSLNDILINKENELINYLNSNSSITIFEELISNSSQELNWASNKYLIEIIRKLNLNDKTKINVLNSKLAFNIKLCIWEKLSNKDKITYLENNSNIELINYELEKEKEFSSEILNNKEIIKNTNDLTINLNNISLIKKDNKNILPKLNSETLIRFLNYKFNNLNELEDFFNSNPTLINHVNNNSLIINDKQINKNIQNADILKLIDTNILIKCLNNNDIEKLSNKELKSQILIYKTGDMNLISNNIKDFSLTIDSSINLNQNQIKEFNIIKKFKSNTILYIINNYYNEEDKIALLRNDEFLNIIPDFTLEMILNNMHFNSVFNMLQNQIIFNKINNIDVNIDKKDQILIPGYLDSPRLISKTNHNMLTEMLNNLNSSLVAKYLQLPYIYEELNNKELISISLNSKINILNLLIKNNVNNYDLINYINKMWQNNIDYSLINNDYVKKNILNLSNEQIKAIDFDEVIYLFDKISTYDNITIEGSKKTLKTFKAILSFYLSFGLNNALKYAEQGNKNIKLIDVKKLEKKIINHELYNFKINNANIFDNMTNKIINQLNSINDTNSLKQLIDNNPYLKNVINLADIYNYGNAYNIFNDYIDYRIINIDMANIKLYHYVHGLISTIYQSQRVIKQKEYDKFILNNFKVKESANYNRKLKLENTYVKQLKLKVLLSTILSNNKDNYQILFKENYNANNIINIYEKYISKEKIDIKNVIKYILIPLVNNTFSYEDTLNKMNIKVSKYFKLYLEEEKEFEIVNKINKEVKNLLSKYNDVNKINILNYLCFGIDLIGINGKDYKTFNSIHDQLAYLSGNISYNKINYNIEYQHNVILSNEVDLIKYQNYIKTIKRIIDKTETFVSRAIITSQVKKIYSEEINNYINNIKISYKLNSHNYEMRKHVFNLSNIENIFADYDLNSSNILDNTFKETFLDSNYLALAGEGYFLNSIPHFGNLISNWNVLKNTQKDLETSKYDIFDYYKLLNKSKNNVFLDNTVIADLNSIDKHIFDNNNAQRINKANILYSKMLNRYLGSIPMVNGCCDGIKYEINDYHNATTLTSLYPISIADEKLHEYFCLNENGTYINFYDIKSNKLIANMSAIRNGNIVYLNNLNYLVKGFNVNKAIKDLSYKIINKSNNEEKINYIILNIDYNEDLNNFIKVNKSVIKNINNPLINYNNNSFIFNDQFTYLIAANKEFAKNNILYYQPTILYPRNRGNYKVISNLATNEDIKNVEQILYQFSKENYKPLNMNNYKEIIYGDDWFIAKKIDNNYDIINLEIDPRANIEIDNYLNKSKNKTKSIIKVA